MTERRLATRARSGLAAGLPPGILILTLDGVRPAGTLLPGQRIVTRERGAMVLRRLVRRPLPPSATFVEVRRGSLGGKPDRDVILPSGQRMLVRDWRAKALWGAAAARVQLARLIDGEFIRWAETGPREVLHLHFDADVTVYASGLELVSAAPV